MTTATNNRQRALAAVKLAGDVLDEVASIAAKPAPEVPKAEEKPGEVFTGADDADAAKLRPGLPCIDSQNREEEGIVYGTISSVSDGVVDFIDEMGKVRKCLIDDRLMVPRRGSMIDRMIPNAKPATEADAQGKDIGSPRPVATPTSEPIKNQYGDGFSSFRPGSIVINGEMTDRDQESFGVFLRFDKNGDDPKGMILVLTAGGSLSQWNTEYCEGPTPGSRLDAITDVIAAALVRDPEFGGLVRTQAATAVPTMQAGGDPFYKIMNGVMEAHAEADDIVTDFGSDKQNENDLKEMNEHFDDLVFSLQKLSNRFCFNMAGKAARQ